MEFLLLPSTYSQRLFEVLKSWSSLPESVIDLTDLFEMLDVPASLRANFKDFRRRVLEKAHKDITTQTGLRYQWEPIKQGRAVAAIRFTFGGRSVQASDKKNQAQRSRDNDLLKKAVSCFKSKGSSCTPKGNKQCELCKRLVRS
jgi:plasmid replication initiation protein